MEGALQPVGTSSVTDPFESPPVAAVYVKVIVFPVEPLATLAVGVVSVPLPSAASREVERESNHTLGAVPREHRSLHRDFLRSALIEQSADLRVLAFGVLAHHHEIDVAALAAGEWAANAGIQHRRPDTGILIEAAPDWQQQSVERHVVPVRLRPGRRHIQDRRCAARVRRE